MVLAHICTGIDIGTYSVKVAEVESSSKGLRLNSLKEYSLNQDPKYDRRIELIDFFLRLSGEISESQQFILGVKQNLVTLRRCHFPFRERHKILKSVAFELEDEIPFLRKILSLMSKFWAMKGTQSEVLATACPKEYIRDLLELCQDGSIHPSLISVEGMATANVFSELVKDANILPFPFDDNEVADDSVSSSQGSARLVLQLGHESSLLMIFRDKNMVDIRSIDFGGQTVISAIANTYKIQLSEAGKELRDKSYVIFSAEEEQVSTKEQVVFSDVIKKSFNSLVTDVQLTLLEKKIELNLKYEEVLITGGLSQIQNIGLYLTQRLGLPTNRLTKKSFNSLIMSMDSYSLTWGATAIGLALEGFKKYKDPPTDLLKGEFAQKNDALQRNWEKWSEVIRMSAIVMVLFFIFSVTRYQLATDLNDLSQSQVKKQGKVVTGLKGKKANERNIKKWIQKEKKFKDSLDAAKDFQKRDSVMDILKKISSVAPLKDSMKLEIESLKIVDGNIILEGRVGRIEDLKPLVKTFEDISKDKKIETLKPSLKSEEGMVAFHYQFEINPQGGGTL